MMIPKRLFNHFGSMNTLLVYYVWTLNNNYNDPVLVQISLDCSHFFIHTMFILLRTFTLWSLSRDLSAHLDSPTHKLFLEKKKQFNYFISLFFVVVVIVFFNCLSTHCCLFFHPFSSFSCSVNYSLLSERFVVVGISHCEFSPWKKCC